jgi:hypothetical protein
VHDAIVLGLGGKATEEAVHTMNKATFDTGRDYNLVQNILDATLETIEVMSDDQVAQLKPVGEGESAVTPAEIVDQLSKLNEANNIARKEFYSKDLMVGNAAGLNGTMYDSSTGSKDVNDIIGNKLKSKLKEKNTSMEAVIDKAIKDCK